MCNCAPWQLFLVLFAFLNTLFQIAIIQKKKDICFTVRTLNLYSKIGLNELPIIPAVAFYILLVYYICVNY